MKVLLWIKKEVFHVFPVFVFFLVAFVAINVVEGYLFRRAGIAPVTFLQIVIAAALVAKILLVIDHLKLVNLFKNQPLIWTVLWKTLVYWVMTSWIRLLLRFFPFIVRGEPLEFDLDNFIWQMDWHFFGAVQVVYLLLFLQFVTGRELTEVIGVQKMRKLFFGI